MKLLPTDTLLYLYKQIKQCKLHFEQSMQIHDVLSFASYPVLLTGYARNVVLNYTLFKVQFTLLYLFIFIAIIV